MLNVVAFLAIVMAVIFFVPRIRAWLLEQVKAASDLIVAFLLRTTSRFGSELTEEGRGEQKLWREQRLRNLRGLALRSKEKWEKTE